MKSKEWFGVNDFGERVDRVASGLDKQVWCESGI